MVKTEEYDNVDPVFDINCQRYNSLRCGPLTKAE